MLEDKLARVLKLKAQRDQIDAELRSMFGMAEVPKRGRPRKEHNSGNSLSESTSEALTEFPPASESE